MTQNSDGKQYEKNIIHVDPDLEDLIPGFLENRQKDVKSIDDALKKKDYETIRILGHGMKGAGGGYGFDGITEIGKFIEQAAKVENPEEIQKQIKKLLTYIENVEIVYASD